MSRYDAGRYTAGVFLYDRSLTLYERARRYASLFHNMWIERSAAGLTRGGDEWNYGAPGSIFVGSDGGLYRYVDIDGDGKSDAITMVWDWSELFGGGGGSRSAGSISSFKSPHKRERTTAPSRIKPSKSILSKVSSAVCHQYTPGPGASDCFLSFLAAVQCPLFR